MCLWFCLTRVITQELDQTMLNKESQRQGLSTEMFFLSFKLVFFRDEMW